MSKAEDVAETAVHKMQQISKQLVDLFTNKLLYRVFSFNNCAGTF